MAETMEITAMLPYFGCKRTCAPQIEPEIGRHHSWWDLCCASMAMTFGKAPCRMETVVDQYWDVTNLARVMQHRWLGPQLYRRLRRAVCADSLFEDAFARISAERRSGVGDMLDLERAYDFFLVSWLGRNGTAGTGLFNQGFCRRFTNNGGSAAKRLVSSVESIPAMRRRMRDLTILTADLFELLPRIDDAEGTVIYVDPPYLVKGADYVHDFTAEDHVRLAEGLRRFEQTRVLVSYYEHPALDGLYPGWTKRRLKATKALVNQGRRDKEGSVEAPEVLLINGPSFVESAARELF